MLAGQVTSWGLFCAGVLAAFPVLEQLVILVTMEISVGTLLGLALALQTAATAGLRLVTVQAGQALVHNLVCMRMWLSVPSGKSSLDGSVSVLLPQLVRLRPCGTSARQPASRWMVNHCFAVLFLLHPSAFVFLCCLHPCKSFTQSIAKSP